MNHVRLLWLPLIGSLMIASLLSITTGPLAIAPSDSLKALWQVVSFSPVTTLEHHEQLVISNVRLPRTLLAVVIGALMAICGAVMQGLFRNPLADPGIVGVSSGAALGAAICIVLFPAAGDYLVPFASFVGGLITTLAVYRLAHSSSGTSVTMLLLAGVAISALTGSGIGLLTYLANDMALRDLTLWQMGSLASARWHSIAICGVVLAILIWQFQKQAAALNALLLGEAEARHLGIEVEKLKIKLIMLTAMGVGVAVAAAGMIGFIGLVVPHLIRMMIGPDHRTLLPLSAALGAALLLLADLGARTWMQPAEMPVGLVTAIMGAPFFLALLLSQRSRLG
ncbi:FecCD family ABC transporter permease [Ferrimonas lipolytica]|uniref:Iron ABC transporter permease n=1 Tax=Ferrimonas lipolytica TaxID=2724191 RepID=A0A6H1UAX3_9GAMM|nr:iron ABC transporter permease [Ferrimonas lipolytica]QIZ76215.1 iron ABC transporter permease [Ferrimonas lipolytica]